MSAKDVKSVRGAEKPDCKAVRRKSVQIMKGGMTGIAFSATPLLRKLQSSPAQKSLMTSARIPMAG